MKIFELYFSGNYKRAQYLVVAKDAERAVEVLKASKPAVWDEEDEEWIPSWSLNSVTEITWARPAKGTKEGVYNRFVYIE